MTSYFRSKKDDFKTEALPNDFMGLRAELDEFLTIDTIEDLNRFEEMSREIDLRDSLDIQHIHSWLRKNKLEIKNEI